ncbi:MAG: IS1634 family transposase, partial [Candidatus Ancillula sp.]|nr:IS1634 family transposase [Candidatus Ancillula sp.]
NSIRNITDAHKKGDGYLFSSKFRGKRGSRKDIQEFVLDKSGWEYSKDMKNAKKSTILTRKLENGEIVKEKVVVTWKQKYAIRESIRRDGAIDYVRNMRPSEMKRVLIGRNETKYYDVKVVDEKTGENINLSPHIHIDQELVDFDARSDGFNVITTSEIHMTDKEIIAAYGQLNRIEDCFKVTKTNLKARSVFVWTKEHIEAHFLTCFIALVIVKLLYYKLDSKYSIRRIIDALRSANVAYIAQGYYTNLTPEINIEILKELGLELETSILKTEQINKIMK